MKIVVYGAENQDLYVNKLRLQEKFGGEPPFGRARMAIEFAQAGYETYLAEPNENIMEKQHWEIVESAGVKVIKDDIEASKFADVAIFSHLLVKEFRRLLRRYYHIYHRMQLLLQLARFHQLYYVQS
jgi:H2-forming N5,N10-methylenetetrahydromethanopterin dehydrogenase-like enzyme